MHDSIPPPFLVVVRLRTHLEDAVTQLVAVSGEPSATRAAPLTHRAPRNATAQQSLPIPKPALSVLARSVCVMSGLEIKFH